MRYWGLLLLFLCTVLSAQDLNWYRSNEFFFEIAPIASSQRFRYPYVLRLERLGDVETGLLYKGDEVVGRLERIYEEDSDMLLRESLRDKDGALIEETTYTYNAAGSVVLAQRRASDDQYLAMKFTEDRAGFREFTHADESGGVEYLRYDEFGRLEELQQWKDRELVLKEHSQYEGNEILVRRDYGDGRVVHSVYLHGKVVSETHYEDESVVEELRVVYDEEGRKTQEYFTRNDDVHETRYTYHENSTLASELRLRQGLPQYFIEYGADERKDELFYWEGSLVLKNIYVEERLVERVFYKDGQIVQRYQVSVEE